MKRDPTKRQKQIIDFISQSIEESGYPPTIREIGNHFNIKSTNGVSDHLKALERKGFLKRENAKPRTLRPILNTTKVETVKINIGNKYTCEKCVFLTYHDSIGHCVSYYTCKLIRFVYEHKDHTMPEDFDRQSDIYEECPLLKHKQLMIKTSDNRNKRNDDD